jgi:biopolymer transport protein ExbB/TolQ
MLSAHAPLLEVPFSLANGLTFAFEESSRIGLVVCIVLVILSSFSWAVMVTKFRAVRKLRRRNTSFLRQYRANPEPLGLWVDGETNSEAPLAGVYKAGASELAYHLIGTSSADESSAGRLESAGRLKPSHMDPVECAMESSIGRNVNRLEGGMGVLATAVSGAPFLGLLGTVWGVMDTFSGVAAADGAASLKTMAPGVSSALLTTVVALLVAIPAMFGYNYLVNRIKGLISEIDAFRNELRTGFERWYVDHGRPLSAPVVSGRRLTATDLLSGQSLDEQASPSHRVVKRETARIPSIEVMEELELGELEELEV